MHVEGEIEDEVDDSSGDVFAQVQNGETVVSVWSAIVCPDA